MNMSITLSHIAGYAGIKMRAYLTATHGQKRLEQLPQRSYRLHNVTAINIAISFRGTLTWGRDKTDSERLISPIRI